MKKLLVLAAALACSVPAFAFTSTQSQSDVNKEVASRIEKKETLEAIASAAKSGGVTVSPIGMALTFYGSYDLVLSALIKAGYLPADAVNMLVAQGGGDRTALVAKAIGLGADPTTLTAPTAAGGTAVAPVLGFTGNSFSASRSATLGGAGKVVSPS